MKKPPSWMIQFGPVRYWKKWGPYSVWRGLALSSNSSWFVVYKDLLIDPYTTKLTEKEGSTKVERCEMPKSPGGLARCQASVRNFGSNRSEAGAGLARQEKATRPLSKHAELFGIGQTPLPSDLAPTTGTPLPLPTPLAP